MKKYILIFILTFAAQCYGMTEVARQFSEISRNKILFPTKHIENPSQELCLDYAIELVKYLSTKDAELLRLMQAEEDESVDPCLGDDDDEGYSEIDKLYGEVSRRWRDLRFLSEKIENQEKKEAILSLFTPNEDERDYEKVIKALKN